MTKEQDMPIYQTAGKLTEAIPAERIVQAQAYLTEDDMTQYLDSDLRAAVERVEWRLGHDGLGYVVEAFASRELDEDELKRIAEWTSGQNSDGLGEGFEQQDFAWAEDGDDDEEGGRMISFDWETNESKFVRV